ncbi:helix-turn-helix transcriptional regulator [Ralstonia chuxiongensis]|uniref:helix-turn-helix transcriptional regulator n=1 Tax=Ralstonia chuxiongensis TaxID=2957504 RepID=UPI00292ED58B|nr:helix-turn-helix transcriptional regulator [Ralstonia chuxiongensis]
MEPLSTWKDISARLKKVAQRYKETHEKTDVDLAAEIGVERGNLNHWLNGRRIPKVTEFVALCQLLGVDAADIIQPCSRGLDTDLHADALALRIARLSRDSVRKLEEFLIDQEKLSQISAAQNLDNDRRKKRA